MFDNPKAYERFMGRWSKHLAPQLVEFAGIQDGDGVLDVGSGTGALALSAAAATHRSEIVGLEPCMPYVDYARRQTTDLRVRFDVGDAQKLPYPDASFDKCLALLVINQISDAPRAVAEMQRVTRPGGRVVACVWDSGGGMTMFRVFWDAAVALEPAAEPQHQRHIPYGRSGQLADLWTSAGLEQVEETGLVTLQEFTSFEDFWLPFLGGQGRASSYVTTLPLERQRALRDRVRADLLGSKADGPFTLTAGAWAVRGSVPQR